MPYISFDRRRPNFLYISTGTNRVSVGERLSLDLNIITAEEAYRQHVKHLTYLVGLRHAHILSRGAALAGKLTTNITQVLNKGKIIQAERMNVMGQLKSNVGLMVTAEMMPSFRFVAFYKIPWQRREEVVADSVWVDVADTCPGSVSDTADRLRSKMRPAGR